jgi:stearoyl-CoA desaturase (delta-9 desaturase)
MGVPLFLKRWLDSHHGADPSMDTDPRQAGIDLARIIPFIILHLACLVAFVPGVGWSWPALALAAGLYVVRMFGITAGYHRYFSHRAYRAPRAVQFLLAVLGNSAGQRGPLWWAAHHRHHHRHSDEPDDLHSPKLSGFWWSHLLWFLSGSNYRTRLEAVPDLAKFPELLWLDRFDTVVPLTLAAACYGLGWGLESAGMATSGVQMLVWWCISTVAVAHGTFTINSLAHVWGGRRFATSDTSRNNFVLALLTLGEGWHNNHHHYQAAARQGFRWWEVDLSFYALWTMARLGLVRELKPVPARALSAEASTS